MNFIPTIPSQPLVASSFSLNEGLTVTACPLSDDYSNRHLVEVFSGGWHHKTIFQRHEASPALSVEYVPDIYDYNEYLLTWLELSRRPHVSEGIGNVA